MPIKELDGDDIVKIIGAGKKADIEMIEIGGELKIMFKREITAYEPEAKTHYVVQLPDEAEKGSDSPKEDEQGEFADIMQLINDPLGWEQSQLKPQD